MGPTTFVLIYALANAHTAPTLDHVEFSSIQDCLGAGLAVSSAFKAKPGIDAVPYVCLPVPAKHPNWVRP